MIQIEPSGSFGTEVSLGMEDVHAEQYPADLVIGQEFHNTNLLAPAA